MSLKKHNNFQTTVYRDRIVYLIDPSELGDCDVEWWAEEGIISKPDITAPQLMLHSKYACCSAFEKIIYSYFMNDWTCTGSKEAHQAHCGRCGKKIAGMLPHKIEVDQIGETVLYFGKHKGKPLKEVPNDYLTWCADNLKDQKIVKKIKLYLESSIDTDTPSP